MGCRKLTVSDYFSFTEQSKSADRVRRNSTERRPYRQFPDTPETNLYGDFKLIDDSLNRLTKEVSECADKAELAYTDEYTYDLVGNRLKKCSSGFQPETLTYTYNANDQLTLESSPTKGDTIYSYDANGSQIGKVNTTANESYTYSYNLQNRLSTATITRMEGTSLVNITSSYVYNQAGIRVGANTSTKIDGGTPEVKNTTYLTDPANFTGYSQVLEESTNGTLTKSYTIGDDVLSQSSFQNSSTPEIKNFLYDGHGSTRLLTSATSAIAGRFDYDAYGKNLFSANATSPAATDMLYSGEQFDPNLQMQYLRARYYDQNNGRFNRLDPFGGNRYDPQSLHKYGYCHNAPVMNYDPTGKLKATAAVFGLVAHLVIQAHYALEKGNYTELLEASSSVISALEMLVPLLKAGVEEISADAAFLLDLISFRPDIVNRMTGEMFEIKPNTPRNITLGQTQLAGYVAKLTLLKPLVPPLVWHPGVDWHSTFYPLGVASIQATFLGNGMIVYDRIGDWQNWLRQGEFKRVMDAAAVALGAVALFQIAQSTAVTGLIIGKVTSLVGIIQYDLAVTFQAVFSKPTAAFGL